MTKLEKEIEAKLRKMVERHGGRCDKLVNVSFYGFPDRTILLPGGLIMFAETKRPKDGKIAALQKWWWRTLTELGFYSCFVFNEEDVDALEVLILESSPRCYR